MAAVVKKKAATVRTGDKVPSTVVRAAKPTVRVGDKVPAVVIHPGPGRGTQTTNSPGRGAQSTNGRNAPRSEYNASWELLFAILDPDHRSPKAFRDAVEWNAMDLVRMAKEKRAIHDDKIKRLRDFCTLHKVSLPLEADHPALKRLKEIELQEMYERLARERLAETTR